MKYPTDAEIRTIMLRLTPMKKGEHASLERQVLKAFDFARAASPDGYPARTASDGRGGGDLTSVEGAADVLLFGRKGDDSDNLNELWASLVEWAGNQDRVFNKIRLLAAGRGEDIETDHRWCEVHALIGKQVGGADTKITLTTCGGRLDKPAALCEPCRDVTRKYLRRLPTRAEMQHYHETGTWRITGQAQARTA